MTKLEIWNRALAALGHDRAVAGLDSGMTEAVRCRTFYDAAKKDCLAEHDWDFAAVEQTFGAMPADENGWATLQKPADALRIVSAKDADGRPMQMRRDRNFLKVRTGGAPVTLRWISEEVEEEEFPHKFAEAVAYQLAALIAGPMFGSDQKTSNYMNLARQKLSDALTKETDETAWRGEWRNPILEARR